MQNPVLAMMDTHSHLSSTFWRSRNIHEDKSERPTTTPKATLSLCQPMGAAGLFCYKSLLQFGGLQFRQTRCQGTRRQQYRRKFANFSDPPGFEIVFPAERNHAALALETMKVKDPEGKCGDIAEQCVLKRSRLREKIGSPREKRDLSHQKDRFALTGAFIRRARALSCAISEIQHCNFFTAALSRPGIDIDRGCSC